MIYFPEFTPRKFQKLDFMQIIILTFVTIMILFIAIDFVAVFIGLSSGITGYLFVVMFLCGIKLSSIILVILYIFKPDIQIPKLTYFYAFISIGGIFCIAFVVLVCEMIRVMHSIKAAFESPFVLDMIPVIIMNILATIHVNQNKQKIIYYYI